MEYSTLTSEAIVDHQLHQLQNSLNNISTQLQLEKASSQAKDTRIKFLQDLIIEHDSKGVNAVERLIKMKNDDIAALKRQLKEELKDKLIDEWKEIEEEWDTWIHSKQSELATTPVTVIPTVSTAVPLTLAASLAPTAPPATSLPITTESTTVGTSTKKTAEFVKAMEKMSTAEFVKAMEEMSTTEFLKAMEEISIRSTELLKKLKKLNSNYKHRAQS